MGSYYLQANSKLSCDTIVGCLKRAANAAMSKADVSSKFRKAQRCASSIYDSNYFQALSSLLIIAVS